MSSKDSVKIEKIYKLFHALGITSNYKGYFHASFAIFLAIKDSQTSSLAMRNLYGAIAQNYNTTVAAVEWNIRTVIENVWKFRPTTLEKLAGYSLQRRPSPAAFVSLIAQAIQNPNLNLEQLVLKD